MKRFLWVILILGLFIVLGYIMPHYFIAMSVRTRAIIGVIFQFLAGLIFLTDQTIGKMPEVGIEKINQHLKRALTNKQPKLVLLALLVVFPFGILAWMWISNPTEMNYEVFGGFVIWLVIGYYIYLFFLGKLAGIFSKWKPDKKENALYYANFILFTCSVPLLWLLIYLGRLDVTDTILLVLKMVAIFLIAFCVPAILLSVAYYIVLGGLAIFKLFYLRFKQRYLLWIIIFLLWAWASILLLMNVLSSD